MSNSSSFGGNKTLRFLHGLEDLILVILLSIMILLAVAQIFLRNLFEGGFVWGDPLLRILVLWIGLLGAMVATRQDRQIKMDVLTRYLPKRLGCVSEAVVELFAALVCFAASWCSVVFVMDEFRFGGMAFSVVPAWVCASIIPFAFLVIGVRYLVLSITKYKRSLELKQ